MELPLQKATYRARVAQSRGFGMSSNNNAQVALECEIVDDENHTGERITWIGTFAPNTTDRTLESLRIAGWTGEDLAELDEGCDVAKLLPEAFDLVCEPEQDKDGNWRLRAQWINRPGAGRFAFKSKLEGGELKNFAASMKAAVAGSRGPQARKPPAQRNGAGGSRPQQPHPNAPGGSDDIPF